ncbi:chromosome segregation protein SMC [Siminovitchia sp. 179-K 8D1 HS]|uniref:chromosome segregation protein SMC n=1 Tax=Siminovitchia sp. 179-K 8D1 HS TaxID=3142385 RepID=UPI0039A06BB2
MFLKQLTIFGFKSFAEKVSIDFVPGVTAVVGPNGSGKSNITDALRWVLGEQSAKSLRGGTMEDVIFAGSDSRKPLNIAEVSILLDNESGLLPIHYNEVSVKRCVYRTGESEFFINGTRCRLRDIVDLFTDSGLGREAFSIISQGKVDQILNSKPEERRTIFEEAAGVLKYKQRKLKAEGKLAETEDNLNRVNDILHELDGQLETLKAQAEKAQMYLDKKRLKEKSEIALTVCQIETLYQEWELANSEWEERTESEKSAANAVQQAEAALAAQRENQDGLDEAISSLQNVLLEVSGQLEKLEGTSQVLQERKKNTNEQIGQLQVSIQEAGSKMQSLKEELETTKKVIQKKDQEMKHIQDELLKKKEELDCFDDQIEATIDSLKSDYVEILNERASEKNRLQYLENQLSQQEIKLKKANENYDKYTEGYQEIKTSLSGKKAKLAHLLQALEDITQQEKDLVEQMDGLKMKMDQQQSILMESYRIADKLKAQKESLESLAEDYAGYFQGVREVLRAKKSVLPGIEGAVAELVDVPKELETAIEIALGSAVQHVIVQSEEDARKAIEFLKINKLGRATFLPLNIVKPKKLQTEQILFLQRHSPFVGLASQLIRFDKKYEPAIENLLGNVIIAKDLQGATQLAKLLQYRFRIVTIDGEVINPGGSMTGGKSKQKRNSLVGRKNEIARYKKELRAVETTISNQKLETDRLKEQLEKHHRLLGEAGKIKKKRLQERQELEKQISQLEINQKNAQDYMALFAMEKKEMTGECSAIQEQMKQVASALENSQRNIARLDKKIEELTKKRNEQRQNKELLAGDISELNTRYAALHEQKLAEETNRARLIQTLKELKNQLEDAKKRLSSLQEESEKLEQNIVDNDQQINVMQRKKEETIREAAHRREERNAIQQSILSIEKEMREIKRKHRQMMNLAKESELKKNRLEMELENYAHILKNEYALSYEQAKAEYPLEETPEEAKGRLERLKSEIREMGSVNIGAIDEYERVNSRYEFLTEQQRDLLKAKGTLEQIMDEMDGEMVKRFGQTFASIQQSFEDVFRSLFGGGRAKLELTAPDDLLNTGVEIVAQPPGKKLQNLSLLSGGERSMTAIALLFSILKVRPVPFCVLDEVEAALDEANVHRFSNYLKEFSQNTQFIVITHRQGTMAGADVLYGVTMQESGVSKLVSVKLEEAKVLA